MYCIDVVPNEITQSLRFQRGNYCEMNLFYLQLCATVHLSESLAYAGRDLLDFESWGLRRSRKVWRWESIHVVHVIFAIYINS